MGLGHIFFKTIFGRFLAKGMLLRAEKASGTAKVGFYYKLLSDYITLYPQKAYSLAAVIANEVFSDPTPEGKASNFLRNNQKLITDEIRRIGQDPETCGFILRALYTKGVYYAYGKKQHEFYLRSRNKLRKYDWFMPDENPELDEFEKEAWDFMEKYKKRASNINKERSL